MEIQNILAKCWANGIKVYPVRKNGKWYIQREVLGKKYTYPKEIEQKEINEAMEKTYIHLYKTML